MTRQPFVTPSDSVTPLQLVGEQIRVLASGEATGSYEVFLQTGPEGAGPPPHSHPWDEAYFVIEGQIDVLTGDRTTTLSAGDFVHIPAGTVHGFRMKTETATFLSLNSRPGAASFFTEVDRVIGGAMDVPKLLAVAAHHDVRIAPPPGSP
jgi:quercetin dioxygenase-like cupin family protein